ncbi:MAG: transcription antitermination factor NusB [Alphaproteobacteria bacterium]|nr:transcription antitermination factor NusB [Alphaproteobacteria bacterium]
MTETTLRPRTAARLCAVQALYQIEIAGATPADTVEQFLAYRIGHTVEGIDFRNADRALFRELVLGASARQAEIDPRLAATLVEGWSLARLERILRAILRAGTFELLVQSDVPVRVIINEYVDVAHAFFAGAEPGIVNAVLDRLGRELRAPELEQPAL